MEQQIKSKLEEVIHLLDYLKREVEESRSYIERGDKTNAQRNQNDSRDEMQNLTRKWEDLQKLLSQT